jgi:hypothetical protein
MHSAQSQLKTFLQRRAYMNDSAKGMSKVATKKQPDAISSAGTI